MPNKEIKISATLDAQHFDQQVERIQRRLREISAPREQAQEYQQVQRRLERQGFEFDQRAEANFKKASQESHRNLNEFIRNSQQSIANYDKALESNRRKLEDLHNIQKQVLRTEEERKQVVEDINKVEGTIARQRAARAAAVRGMGEALQQTEEMGGMFMPPPSPTGVGRLATAYQYGGLPGAGRAAMRMMRAAPAATMMAGGLAGIGTGMQIADPLFRDIVVRRNLAVMQAQGGAASGLSEQMQDVYSRQLQRQTFFNTERQQAMQEALRQNRLGRATDVASLFGRGAAIGGGLVTAGAGLTAATMGAGAIPGAAMMAGGGLLAAGGAAYTLATNERIRSRLIDPERYNAILAREFADNYRSNMEARIQRDPMRRMAIGRYMEGFQTDLQRQRMLGMGDPSMFFGPDSFYGQANQGGFLEDQAASAAAQVISAGGSTRVARNILPAMRLQREMDITNAPTMMGRISKTMGDVAQTEQTTVRILSEGVKLGLDASTMAEEQRQFAENVSQIVVQSAAGTAAQAGNIAGAAAAFAGADLTPYGLTQMGNLYQMQQEMTRQMQGPRGAIQASLLERSPFLQGMSQEQLAFIAGRKQEEVTTEGTMGAPFRAMGGEIFERTGGRMVIEGVENTFESAEELTAALVDHIKNIKNKTVFLRTETDKQVESIVRDLEQAAKEGGPKSAKRLIETEEFQQRIATAGISAALGDERLMGLNTRQLMQYMEGIITQQVGARMPEEERQATVDELLSGMRGAADTGLVSKRPAEEVLGLTDTAGEGLITPMEEGGMTLTPEARRERRKRRLAPGLKEIAEAIEPTPRLATRPDERRQRVADVTVRGMAAQERTVREEFQKNYASIAESARDTALQSDEMRRALTGFVAAFKENGEKVNDAVIEFAEKIIDVSRRAEERMGRGATPIPSVPRIESERRVMPGGSGNTGRR